MDSLYSLLLWIQKQLTENQILIGVIGGSVGYFLLKFFSIISGILKNFFVSNVEVNTSTGDAITSVESYFNTPEFLNKSFLHKKLSFLGISKKDDTPILTPGYDKHLFFYKHWPFMVEKIKDEKVNNKIAYSYVISTIGFSSKKILNFIKDISKKIRENKSDSLSIFSIGVEYASTYEIDKRTIDSIFFNKNDKKRLLDRLDFFIKNEDWYAKRGIPYKLGILFHGLPGTGKSSLIKAIATYLDSSIIYVNAESDKSSLLDAIKDSSGDSSSVFTSLESERLNPLIENKKKKFPIVVIEEVDTCLQNRDSETSESIHGMRHSTMNLKDYLNIIDGVLCPPGTIFILTTNYKEKLDPALVRPGRIDIDIEMGAIDKELIQDMIGTYEPNMFIDIPNNIKILPSTLQDILLTYQGNSDKIRENILSKQYTKD